MTLTSESTRLIGWSALTNPSGNLGEGIRPNFVVALVLPRERDGRVALGAEVGPESKGSGGNLNSGTVDSRSVCVISGATWAVLEPDCRLPRRALM